MAWHWHEGTFTVQHAGSPLGETLAAVEQTMRSTGARNVTIMNESTHYTIYYEFEADDDEAPETIAIAGRLILRAALRINGVAVS